MPSDVRIVRRTKKGRSRIAAVGMNWKYTINTIARTNAIEKSTSPERMAAAGMMTRGKYTLEMRFAFASRLWLAPVTPSEKKFHATTPQKVKRRYGTPCTENPTSLLNSTVKTTIPINGRTSAHAAPRKVCLYRILISRHTRK